MEVSWQRAIRNRGALFHTSVLDQARYCLFQDERGCHFLDIFGGKGQSHIFHCGCFITPGLTQQMRMLIKKSESLWCLVPYYKNWCTRYICFKIISQHFIASCLRQNWNDDFTILKWMEWYTHREEMWGSGANRDHAVPAGRGKDGCTPSVRVTTVTWAWVACRY